MTRTRVCKQGFVTNFNLFIYFTNNLKQNYYEKVFTRSFGAWRNDNGSL